MTDVSTAEPTPGQSQSSLAPFISKLFEMISKATDSDYIKWGPSGNTLVVTDPVAFARDVLPRYFKHDNIRSFVRQLNIYGFQRCRNANVPGTEPSGELEFFHESFIEGREDLMIHITRGVPSQKPFVAQKRSLPTSSQPQGYAIEANALLREMYAVQDTITEVGSLLSAQMSSVQSKMSKLTDALGIHFMAQCTNSDGTPIMTRPEEQSLPPSTGGASYGQEGGGEVNASAEREPMADEERSRGALLDSAARLDLSSYHRPAPADGAHPELSQQAHDPYEAPASGGCAEALVSHKTHDHATMGESDELAGAAVQSGELQGVR